MRRPSLAACLVVAGALFALPAGAVVWPDVPERLEHDLASSDAAVRLAATERLDSLGLPRAAPLVLRALGDADPGVRGAAAEVAARRRIAGSTALVLPWLAEHDARLRLEACVVAEAVPDAAAVAPLARALSDTDATVRTMAALALGSQGSREAVAPLLGRLDDASWNVRAELARSLARLGDRRAVLPLIGKVEDPVPEVRLAVARALGDLGDPRAAAALVLQLRDASADVRVGALKALGRVQAVDTVDAVAPSVTDRSPAVRQAALATLGVVASAGSAQALRILVDRVGLDDDATLDVTATPLREALVRAGAGGIPLLRAVLRAGSSAAATTTAAFVLGRLHASAVGVDVIAALRRGALPPAPGLRALGELGSGDALPVVLDYIASDSPSVRGEALKATGALLDNAHPDGRSVEPLIAVTDAPHVDEAELVQVIELLGRTRAPRAAPRLASFLGSRAAGTKLAALDALGALGPAGSDAVLVPLISDAAPEVRLRAADALAASGTGVARDALLDLLAGGTELDRAAALTALAGVLSRAPSPRAVRVLVGELEYVVGGERDAVLAALARGAPVHPVLEGLAAADDADDRRTVMASLAGRTDAHGLLAEHLRDPAASVRAAAAWSLGSVGTLADAELLLRAVEGDAGSGADTAIDATAALGRIGARSHASPPLVCGLLSDPRPLVRANALAGLALEGARCGDGARERALLEDHSELVRGAAARALQGSPLPEDRGALARCETAERSPAVAAACTAERRSPPVGVYQTLAYVEPVTRGAPRPNAAYLVELADGLLRAGTADRRGAFFDPVAPDGPLRLRGRD